MISSKRNWLFLFCLVFVLAGKASPPEVYSKYDYLHGKLNKNRNWFDVTLYDITLKVDPATRFISGSNRMVYKVITPSRKMQLDLHPLIKIDSIVFKGKHLSFTRDSSVVLVSVPRQKKGKLETLTIYFNGNPLLAKKAPWDGGFVFARDSNQRHWVGLACEGMGASVWLPCKDHFSDEADSMMMHLQVPEGLTGVSNGRLTGKEDLGNGFTQFDWKVTYPINNYNITVNVGHYTHFSDEYVARYNKMDTPLTLDYYVLDYNYLKAKKHFTQVKGMMNCFERHFGPYPFWNDGYKLVETPYWGMEHQSCVAYGNDYSNTRWDFDFIIIHESAHEWFGNSLTAKDPAELWLHESFTTHAEAVYIECMQTPESAVKYLKMQKRNVENKRPMVGVQDVFHRFADNDIYYKGSWMLFTIRNVIDNDSLWFNTLRDYSRTFRCSTLTTQQCIDFFSNRTGRPLQKIFEQYLTRAELPVLEYQLVESGNGTLTLRYHWKNVVDGFEMPVKATLTRSGYETLTPVKGWRVIDLNYLDKKEFKILADHYLIETSELP